MTHLLIKDLDIEIIEAKTWGRKRGLDKDFVGRKRDSDSQLIVQQLDHLAINLLIFLQMQLQV